MDNMKEQGNMNHGNTVEHGMARNDATFLITTLCALIVGGSIGAGVMFADSRRVGALEEGVEPGIKLELPNGGRNAVRADIVSIASGNSNEPLMEGRSGAGEKSGRYVVVSE